MPDFSPLHVTLSGLGTGIDDHSLSDADAAIERYTRLRVELAARYPHRLPSGREGAGFEIEGIARVRDSFLDDRFRADIGVFSMVGVRADLLAKAERIFGEPASGLTSELAALWSAFADLAIAPRDAAVRRTVLSHLESAAARVRSIAEGLSALIASGSCSLEATLSDANEMLHQVASLNQAVLETGAAVGGPTEPIDHREVLLDELSSKIGASTTRQPDGSFGVSLHGIALVSEDTFSELTFDITTYSVLHSSGVELSMGGEARGFQTFLRDDVGSLAADLDAFVVGFADTVNATHSAGWVSATEQGGEMFMYDATDPAKTLSVAIADPAMLATATSSGPPFPAFDGGSADALAALRTARMTGGGATLDEAFRAIVTELGRAAANAESSARSQAAWLASSDRARLTTHTGSLDEQIILGLKYQRIYEAAIRVMANIDETLEALADLDGVFGE